jgi:hypothetical protein
MEAEYLAAAEATRDIIWAPKPNWRARVQAGRPNHSPRQSAIRLSANPSTHSRSKHIDIKHHIIRERIEMGTIELE